MHFLKYLLFLTVFSIPFFSILQAQESTYDHKYKFKAELKELAAKDGQTAAFYLSSIGEYKEALRTWDSAVKKRTYKGFNSLKIDSILNVYHFKNAKNFVLQETTKVNYTILNEAHHQPQHRIFAKSLLEELYKQGFKNLAVETLSVKKKYKDTLLNQRKYPLMTSGSYSREPQFGELIRTALQLGFWVYPYDDMSDYNNREINQAKNIITGKKEGKTLIYGGFDHALEGKHPFWGKAMAEHLKILTGEDPLTINQIIFTERSNAEYNHPLYNAIPELKVSRVLVDHTNSSYQIKQGKEGYYDIAIFHPKTSYIHNRPKWVKADDKEWVEINISDFNIELPCQVLAFNIEENYKEAVPMDIVEVSDKTKPFFLALPKGKTRIVVVDKNKNVNEFVKEVN
ncbi:hypothetical protein NBT05_04135 [Aquimarina sp. ERC-38]|uniref:hypothetical protein n=1 Tax=Aquimarina sp. ERC-38 TaxID=2949996 RepID=UPI0022464EB7|nr:hypothetical protein [Aquimarina sp. ERC-38]UZO81664.1 hypothetical protein NBT05_04135 [Aquimarina sp. ERC-38]